MTNFVKPKSDALFRKSFGTSTCRLWASRAPRERSQVQSSRLIASRFPFECGQRLLRFWAPPRWSWTACAGHRRLPPSQIGTGTRLSRT